MSEKAKTRLLLDDNSPCMTELVKWVRKWCGIKKPAQIRSLKIHATVDNVLVVEAGLYGVTLGTLDGEEENSSETE